jgi:hypothetical protein
MGEVEPVLDPVISLLEQCGWCRKSFHDKLTDSYCVLGAMGKAWHEEDTWHYESFNEVERSLLYSFAIYLARRYPEWNMPFISTARNGPEWVVALWNDDIVDSVDEVVRVLRDFDTFRRS